MVRRDENEFTAFVMARGAALRRTAYLLSGDWHTAEDLVQIALVKLYVAWPRVEQATAEAYARKAVVRVFLDARRRRSSTELPTARVADRAAPDNSPDERLILMQALSSLPPGQRAAVVLRHWEDLSVEEVARLLGLSTGTVKSQCSKGLAAMRLMLTATTPEMPR